MAVLRQKKLVTKQNGLSTKKKKPLTRQKKPLAKQNGFGLEQSESGAKQRNARAKSAKSLPGQISSKTKKYGARQARWEKRIAGWEASGLSQAAFCREKGIALHKFKYWRTKLTLPKSAIFAEIPIIKEGCGPDFGHTLLVRVGDRYAVEVPEGFSPDLLGRLIQTLEAI